MEYVHFNFIINFLMVYMYVCIICYYTAPRPAISDKVFFFATRCDALRMGKAFDLLLVHHTTRLVTHRQG